MCKKSSSYQKKRFVEDDQYGYQDPIPSKRKAAKSSVSSATNEIKNLREQMAQMKGQMSSLGSESNEMTS